MPEETLTLTATIDKPPSLPVLKLQLCQVPDTKAAIHPTHFCETAQQLHRCDDEKGVSRCTWTFTAEKVGQYHYYAMAQDPLGFIGGSQVFPLTVNAPVSIALSNPSQPNLLAGHPQRFDVTIQPTRATGSLQLNDLTLQVAGMKRSGKQVRFCVGTIKSIADCQPVTQTSVQGTTPLTLFFTPTSADAGQQTIQVNASFSAGEQQDKVHSEPVRISVALPPPPIPTVTITRLNTPKDSGYQLNIADLAIAQQVQLCRMLPTTPALADLPPLCDPNKSTGQSLQVTHSSILHPLYTSSALHGQSLQLCVRSQNKQHPTATTWQASAWSCEIKIGQMSHAQPDRAYFKPISLQQSGPYQLSWTHPPLSLADYYQVQSWPGQPGDYQQATQRGQVITSGQLPLHPAQFNPFANGTSPVLGPHSYQLAACLRTQPAQCQLSHIFTLTHLAPLLHSGRVEQLPEKHDRLVLQGVGLNTTQARLAIRLRRTAEVFHFTPSQMTASAGQLHVDIPARVYQGAQQGGIYLKFSNGVVDRHGTPLYSELVIDQSNRTTAAPYQSLKDNPFVLSANQRLYLAKDKGIQAFALHQTGLVALWDFATKQPVVAAPLVQSHGQRDRLYFGGLDQHVYRVDHDGIAQWHYRTQGAIVASPQLGLFKDNRPQDLYVGSMDKALYSLNSQTGQVNWQYLFPAGITQQPQLGGDGRLYITTKDGQLYILNRSQIGLNALQWQGISPPKLKALLKHHHPNGLDPPAIANSGSTIGAAVLCTIRPSAHTTRAHLIGVRDALPIIAVRNHYGVTEQQSRPCSVS